MRLRVSFACALLSGVAALQGQVQWNFTAGTGAPSSLPAHLTGGIIAAANSSAALAVNPTSASSGYTGASGGNNAAFTCRTGPLSTATSTCAEFTFTASTGHQFTATGLTLGTRSTGTGPIRLTLYCSADNYATALASANVSANSNYALVALTGFSVASSTAGSITFRLYCSDGTGSAGSGNWRIDDLAFSVTATAQLPIIGTPLASQTITSGQAASFTVIATGTGPLHYQWRKSGAPIGGNATALTATLNLGAVTTAAAGDYDVVVTDALGSVTASAAHLTVNPIATTLALANLAATYDGSPHTATATATPAGATLALTYQGSATAPTDAGTYTVVATITDPERTGPNATGTLVVAKAAQTVAFTPLNPVATIGVPLTLAATATSGHPVTFSLVSGHAMLSDSTLTLADASPVVVRATQAGDTNHFSASADLSFTAGTKLAQTIAFATPADRYTTAAPFTLAATSNSALAVSFSVVSGPASISGNVITLTGDTGTVTVRATQAGGAAYLPAVDVDRTFAVTLAPAAPLFVTLPAAQSVTVGDPVAFTASATGSPAPTLQWRRNGSAIAGATSATLTVASSALIDAGTYDCVATNSSGTANTPAVSLTVGKRAQTIAFLTPTGAFAAGTTVPLAATATSALPVSFAIVSGGGSMSGNLLRGDGGPVVIRATQPGDASKWAAATPIDRLFTVVSGGDTPFFGSQPASQMVNVGTTVTFSASGIGTPAPTYQWQKNGAALPGATTATLTLNTVTLADAATYTVVLANGFGSVASAPAILTVRAAPVITVQPLGAEAIVGAPITLSIAATGEPAPSYQWRKNGTALAGGTAATFSVATASTTDAGRYEVVVTNAAGSVTSRTVSVAIGPRAVAGTYFGRFDGAAGDCALLVRADRSAIFLGCLSTLRTGLHALAGEIDLAGNFTLTLTVNAPDHSVATPPLLRGSIGPDGTLRGTLAGLSLGDAAVFALTASLAPAAGPTQVHAGFYQGALVGTTAGQVHALIAADGRAFVLLTDGTSADGAAAALNASGQLAFTTPNSAAIDFTVASGIIAGGVTRGTTTTAVLAAHEALTGRERLVNFSTRAGTAPGDATLIVGFVITGPAAKRVLVRAAGPALATAPFSLPGAHADPAILLLRGATFVAQNDDWNQPAANGTAVAAAAAISGAFPFGADSTDSALVATLSPGSYTVQIVGGTGITLAELYEAPETNEPPGVRRLANFSARGVVSVATGPLIAGFVVGGDAPLRVLVRAIGPTLADAPVNLRGVLPNPHLQLFRGGALVKTNDDWFRGPDAPAIAAASAKAGAFPLPSSSLDACLLLYLEPGAYSAQVTDPTGASGLALVEIYEAPP